MVKEDIARLIRRCIPRKIRQQIGRFGIILGDADFKSFPHTELTFTALKSRGFSPRLIIDVGAYEGWWTGMVKTIFPLSKVVMIEALGSKQSILEEVTKEWDQVILEHALLGSTPGAAVTFFEMQTGSSVLEPDSTYPRKQSNRTLTTLDVLRTKYKWGKIDLLKLDVEGYELEVLRGAQQTLPLCEFVLLECSLVPINKGAPLLNEVVAFMASHKFRIFDLCSQLRRPDQILIQTDILFVKEGSTFIAETELNPSNWYSPS